MKELFVYSIYLYILGVLKYSGYSCCTSLYMWKSTNCIWETWSASYTSGSIDPPSPPPAPLTWIDNKFPIHRGDNGGWGGGGSGYRQLMKSDKKLVNHGGLMQAIGLFLSVSNFPRLWNWETKHFLWVVLKKWSEANKYMDPQKLVGIFLLLSSN